MENMFHASGHMTHLILADVAPSATFDILVIKVVSKNDNLTY